MNTARPPHLPPHPTHSPHPPQPPQHGSVQRPVGVDGIGATSPHPGWVARSLIWLTIALYTVPPVLVAAMMAINPLIGHLFAPATTVVRVVMIFVGIAALLCAKQTTWTRKIIAAVSYFIIWFFVLVITPLLPLFSNPTTAGVSDAVRIPIGLTILFGTTYAAWNSVRNRRWWILLVSFVYAGIFAVAQNLVYIVLQAIGVPPLMSTVAVVGISLLLLYCGFGIFHLLGRIKGAAVPAPSSSAQSLHTHGATHFGPLDPRHGAFPGYPGATGSIGSDMRRRP